MRHAIDLQRDEAGWWVATVRGVSGCHTQGRSLRQALSRIREALATCVDDDVTADQLDPHVHLPAEARMAVARYETTCKRLERQQQAAHVAADLAVEMLVGELSLSVRDAGDVLGLSHQRVHQLVNARSR